MMFDRRVVPWNPWKTVSVLLIGVALSFGVAFALSGVLEPLGMATVVLFGVALTFSVLAMTPADDERMHWAVAPAAIISLFGWMFLVEATSMPDIARVVWPIVLIAGFAYDVYRHRDHGHGSTPALHA